VIGLAALAVGALAPAGRPIPADWVHWDPATKTATITLVAGQEPRNGGWNFNGLVSGEATVTVAARPDSGGSGAP